MEQTINLFSKGLLLDTNPMVQSNDTLSDALNATFITQNGNEVVLLNDMGNRRVDNAFLPPGYEPVGIKEYGGIIYIAAYNPITGKSQIGSFPSPERRMSKFDGDLVNNIDFIGDFRKSVKLNYGLYWLTTDTLLYPLTNKNSIHTGDKFCVYGFSDLESKDNVTNYNNIVYIKADKIKMVRTPLNKTYTLLLGILNSLNEFVDITKTLVRYIDDKRVEFDKDVTDLIRFNTGYFLADGIPDNSILLETENDNNFIIERLVLLLDLNTYAYKLTGPLYLKATLNHIESFNYNILGDYNDELNVIRSLKIEASIVYNCPHYLNLDLQVKVEEELKILLDNDYYTFDDGTIQWDNFFDLYFNDAEMNISSLLKPSNKNTLVQTIYNKITNLYTVKITKEYLNIKNSEEFLYTKGEKEYYPIVENEEEGDKLYYTLAVSTPKKEYLYNRETGEEESIPVYLEGLSVSDVLNLTLLGSGKFFIKEWRFTNEYIRNDLGDIINGTTTLLYTLEAYPRENQLFVDLGMELYEPADGINKITEMELASNFGYSRNLFTFNWNDYGIEPRRFYYIRLRYKILDKETGEYYYYNEEGEQVSGEEYIYTNYINNDGKYNESEKIWFLSTPLFNECYNYNSPKYIKCYFNPRSLKEKNSIKELCTLQVEIFPNETIESLEVKKLEGKLLSTDQSGDPYLSKITKSINFSFNPQIKIKNEDYYPYYIKISENKINNLLNNLILEIIIEYDNDSYKRNEHGEYISEKSGKNLLNLLNESSSKNIYTSSNYSYLWAIKDLISIDSDNPFNITIINYDKLVGKRENSEDIKITHAFNNFYDCMDKVIIDKLMSSELAAGIVLTHDGGSACWIGLVHFNQKDFLDIPNFYGHYSKQKNNSMGGLRNENWFTLEFLHFDGSEEGEYNVKNSPKYYTLLYNGRGDREENGTHIILFKNYSQNGFNKLNEFFKENDSDFLFIFDDPKTDNNAYTLYQIKSIPSSVDDEGNWINFNSEVKELACSEIARVFWRTNDEEWVQLYKPLKISSYANTGLWSSGDRNNSERVKLRLLEYFKNIFSDFIYCFSNEISLREAGLWTYINNYSYNHRYSFPIKIYSKIECEIGEINNIIENNSEFDSEYYPLKFTCKLELIGTSEYYNYTIRSNENFFDSINNINDRSLDGVYIKTGLNHDKNGTLLGTQDLYIETPEHELEIVSPNSNLSKYIKVDVKDVYKFNKLLYNVNTESGKTSPEYQYDWRYNSRLIGPLPKIANHFAIDYSDSLVTPESIRNE